MTRHFVVHRSARAASALGVSLVASTATAQLRVPATDTALAAACTSTRPDSVLHPASPDSPRDARAIWLDAKTLRWPQAGATTPPSAPGRYVLYGSRSGGLAVRPGAIVQGATDTVPLLPRTAPLPAGTLARVRHVGPGPTLQLSASRLPFAYTGQFVLVREDASGRVLEATGTQRALALDDLHATDAEPLTLGAQVSARAVTFRLWAPTAQRVQVCVFERAHDQATPEHNARVVALQRDARSGVWQTTLTPAALRAPAHGTPYVYLVDVFVPGVGVVRNRVADPYALALTANSARAVAVQLDHPSLRPAGWRSRRVPSLARATDQVIYELHVRDFSVQDSTVPAAHRGKYLAFTDSSSAGMQHLRRMARAGLTDVHLLPVFDIASIPEVGCTTPMVRGAPDSEQQQEAVVAQAATDCFNWGYDPLHYTVPEGSYASVASDYAARIREFRSMVQALNASGLRVGMDVVYNHTSASGQHPQSVLDRIVPGYYQRLDATGTIETSTCCANTATEHRMMAKLMIESAVTWVTQYGVSSFRFDLMGHQPRAVMEQLQRAVNRAAGHQVPLIGEGWNFGEVANGARFVQASQLSLNGSGIATFSDRARDAIRGGSPGDDGDAQVRNLGYVNGGATSTAADMVRVGLAGSLRSYRMPRADGAIVPLSDIQYGGSQPAGYVASPTEVVNYVENHDNLTLFDANVLKLPRHTTREERARVQMLASALVLFSQGVAYLHAGQELLRSKSLDRNSFDSGDWFNSYDPTGAIHGFGRGLPPRRDNAKSWPIMRGPLADTSLVPTPANVRFMRDAVLDLLRIRTSTPLFRLGTTAQVVQRLRFANTGPTQEATVVAAHIDGRGLPNARYAHVVYAVNADTVAHAITVPWLAGTALRLHPVHLATDAADVRPRSSTWSSSRGVLRVPPRAAVVWVRE
ncbi:alpha-1,6-glucosidase domain-containing protein [Gemmatimonas sp.]|uniref:alpha-1,6-glucosidase domain-containing protein n=1 Tax=Gemmatimonas sp. TaxID=1962908 RepID=UPI003DA68B02